MTNIILNICIKDSKYNLFSLTYFISSKINQYEMLKGDSCHLSDI